MSFLREKGMFIVLCAIIFGITFLGAWSTQKMENASVEIDPEYAMANIR